MSIYSVILFGKPRSNFVVPNLQSMKSQTIYYLDDDQEDLDFFKEVTESLGHNVLLFTQGRRMLQALDNEAEKPDIIFLDIHMPILNGEEIVDLIKKTKEWKDIPIVMVSGAYPKKLVRHFSEIGVNYLLKRPSIQDFKEAIENVLKMDIKSKQIS